MPKLLFFVPCHKPVIDLEDNSLSVHEVLEGLTVRIPTSTALEPDATLPVTWFAVALWHRLPDDADRQYEQWIELLDPQGKSIINGKSEFRLDDLLNMRTRTQINGFPISQPGEFTLRLALRTSGNTEWEEVATYPILLKHEFVDTIPVTSPSPPRRPRKRKAAAIFEGRDSLH